VDYRQARVVRAIDWYLSSFPDETRAMKFVSFADGDGNERFGVVDEHGAVVDLVAACPDGPATLIDFIAAGDTALAAARAALNAAGAGDRQALETVRLLAPIPRPRKNVFCVGRNYKAHVEEGYRARGGELAYPPAPQFFTKAPTAVFGPRETAILDPGVTAKFDYEAELGIVIGAGGRNIAEAAALDAIFGYTIINDLTARDLQRHHDQWFKGKSLDRSCAVGPWIVHASAIADPQDLAISLSVNGEQRQSSRTSEMIFSIPRIIRDLSLGMTLEPGDLIATGTPHGVGYAMEPPRFLCGGDVIEINIEQIGRLTTRVQEIT
jgi:2-keto-4-pentenoate hydratase/2-oxohepta-3-ene-1,7-dioic acid hydratase in catechol pathway